MHRPPTRRVGRLRTLTIACALAVSVVAGALPASGAGVELSRDVKPAASEVSQPNSWVWTSSSWVWTRSVTLVARGSATTQSWVWTR